MGVLLLAAILLLAIVLSPDPKVVWLSPSELSKPTHSTVFTRFKYRLAVLVWPLIHSFWHGHPSIMTDATFLTLSANTMNQTGLDVPFATNASGLRIWVLSATELASFRKRLSAVTGASRLSKSRVQTADGMQAQLSVIGPTSLTVDILPKVASGSIKLTIGVTATELIASAPGNRGVTKTNLAAACRVLVPNAGGLIIDGGNAKDGTGNTYWLIASPTVVDARGNPIKP